MRFAGIAGIKDDGSVQGLGIGKADEILKKFKSSSFEGFAKALYFEDGGRRISKAGSSEPKPKPKAKSKVK